MTIRNHVRRLCTNTRRRDKLIENISTYLHLDIYIHSYIDMFVVIKYTCTGVDLKLLFLLLIIINNY